MRSYNHGRFQQQANFLRRQFLQDGDLPFADVLSEGIVSQAMTAINFVWLDRIYSPLDSPTVGSRLAGEGEARQFPARSLGLKPEVVIGRCDLERRNGRQGAVSASS
jgi:hypothetical protein